MELNIASLRETVSEEIFEQGLKLYLCKQIDTKILVSTNLGKEVKYTYPIQTLDNLNTYNVVLKISKDNDSYFMSGALCKCYYCHNNKAICEHIVALALVIMQHLNYGNEELGLYANLLYKKEKEQKLVNVFNNYDIDNVKLRPNFTIENDKILLRLNIFANKEYIVSNINHFLLAIKNNEVLKYGKKLEFVHNINCFHKKAKRLIQLLSLSNCEVEGKYLVITPLIFEHILDIFKNDIILMSVNENTYKINNTLEDSKLNVLVNDEEVVLQVPTNINIVKSFNNIILLNNDHTSIIKLSNYEIDFVSFLLDNNNKMKIVDNKDFFFNKIFPKIKTITTLSDELAEQFPTYDISINSYFDFNNGKIDVRLEIFEDNRLVEKDKLAVLSKTKYYDYLDLLREYNFSTTTFNISDTTDILDFLHADLSKFKEFGEVYLSEKIKRANIKKTGKFSLNIKYDLNLLELNIDSKMSNEDLESILNAYKNKEKFVILKNNVIFEIDDDVKELSRIVDEYDLDSSNLSESKVKPNYNILSLLKEDNFKSSSELDILDDFINYSSKEIYPIDSIKEVLRTYQLEAFRWLSTLSKYKFGGLLADDMGLGKTLEILSLILSDDSNKPSIIVSPMSLVYNWSNEIIKWNSNIDVQIIMGNVKERLDIINKIDFNKKSIYLVSYDVLKKDIEHIKGQFRYVVIDEAQYIKNKNTKTATSVKQLNSEVRFALTGTPIENSLSDLWSIFDFILPEYLSSYTKFKEDFEVVSDYYDNSLDVLQKKVAPFILRRTKKDVLTELPDKIEEVYYATLVDEQRELYDAYLNKARNSLNNSNEIEILSILTRLRQICVSPNMFIENYKDQEVKIDLAIDLITKGINGNHKILLFSQFTSSFESLSKRLEDNGIKYYTLTGKTNAKDRINLVNDFNNSDDIKVFLISLKAGGTGLNLYGADTVIHLDPWWNSSAEAQATDRAHRIGQKKVLNVIKLICANTIEEKVLQLQNVKAELSSKVIDDNRGKKLNVKDLDFLLS